VSAEIGRIRQFVTGQVGTVRNLIRTDVRKAKEELEKHVGKIHMCPQTDGKKGYYVAEGGWNLLGGYDEVAGRATNEYDWMVAGA